MIVLYLLQQIRFSALFAKRFLGSVNENFSTKHFFFCSTLLTVHQQNCGLIVRFDVKVTELFFLVQPMTKFKIVFLFSTFLFHKELMHTCFCEYYT